MSLYRLTLLAVRARWRELIPSNVARHAVEVAVLVVFVLMNVVALQAGAWPPGSLVGMMAVLGMFSALLAGASALRGLTARRPRAERIQLLDLAPLAPWKKTFVQASPALASALAPIVVLVLPPLVALFVGDAEAAFVFVLKWGSTLLWAVAVAVCFTVLCLQFLGSRRGRAVAAFLGHGVLGASVVLPVVYLAGSPYEMAPAAWYVTTAGAAVPLLVWGGAVYGRQIGASARPPTSRPPRWGRPGWWGRLLFRTELIPTLAGAVLLALWARHEDPFLGTVFVATLVPYWTCYPVLLLLAPEHERPDRWRIAPHAQNLRASLLRSVGLPFLLLGACVLLGHAWGRWTWIALVLALSVVSLGAAFIPGRVLRGVVRALTLLAALASALLLHSPSAASG